MDGVARIARERKRQIEEEGWDAEHDEQHRGGELAGVAALYVIAAVGELGEQAWDAVFSWLWPPRWDRRWWKPGFAPFCLNEAEIQRCLEKAGALIAAELDRRERRSQTDAK